jgi:hypothetical protein
LHGKRTRETNKLEERGGGRSHVHTNPTRQFWRCDVDATLAQSRLSRSERRRSGARIGASRNSATSFRLKPAALKWRPRVFAPKGQPQISPGHRPGTIATHSSDPSRGATSPTSCFTLSGLVFRGNSHSPGVALGFTHYWGRSQQGAWVVKRKTARSRLKRAFSALSEWCRKNLHLPIKEQHPDLPASKAAHPLKAREEYQCDRDDDER